MAARCSVPPTGTVAVIIPAFNERQALPKVLSALDPAVADRVVVVDNGSTDGTPDVARQAGAEVVSEPLRGYGRACQAGLATLASDPPTFVAFLDADFSDHPEELGDLLAPLREDRADLVIGVRVAARRERGAIAWQALWGNRLVTGLIRAIWKVPCSDLGPFRALRWSALPRLRLRDPDYGWNVEMQVRAIQASLRVVEVPVSYRRRTGQSKISGTVSGTVRAGGKMLWTVFTLALER
ncbi:MAG: glycosyltransferase family 2 protein [Acidobacteriota bacterium]